MSNCWRWRDDGEGVGKGVLVARGFVLLWEGDCEWGVYECSVLEEGVTYGRWLGEEEGSLAARLFVEKGEGVMKGFLEKSVCMWVQLKLFWMEDVFV